MPYGWVSAAAALYGAVNSSSSSGGGGSANGVPGAMTYVPKWQGGADTLWQQLMQQFGGLAQGDANTIAPYLMNSFMADQSRVPWMQSRMDSMGDTLDSVGTRFLNAQDHLYGAGDRVFNTALDPEGALHDRTQQQLVDASRASSSARGIAMSPESAGLENQTVSNFNLDWNDRQLQRQIQGLQGLDSAYTAGGQQGVAGAGAYADAANMYTGAMKLPYNLAGLYGGAMGSSVYNPMNALQGDLSTYMGLGQSGSAGAFGQNQTNMNNLMSGISAVPWSQIGQWFSGNNLNPGNIPDSSGSGASSTVDNTTWGGA